MTDEAAGQTTLAGAAALLSAGRLPEAEAAYRSLAEAGNVAEVLHGIGAARLAAGDAEGALPYLDAAAVLGSESRFAFNRAAALVRLHRIADAKTALRALVERDPGYLPAPRMLSDILVGGGEREAAADVRGVLLDRAITAGSSTVIREEVTAIVAIGRAPSNWATIANKLRIGGREAEANRMLELRLASAPDCLRARFIRTMNRLAVVYGSNDEIQMRRKLYSGDLEDLAKRVAAASPDALAEAAQEVGMAKPFFLSYQGRDDTDLQRIYGDIVHTLTAAAFPAPATLAGQPRGRIRVGFATSYFTLHSVSKLFRGWIEQIDRRRFEVFGYQFSEDRDETRDAIAAAADHWRSGTASAASWRKTIETDRLHALVYLELGMNTIAVQLASQRLAPVQAATWGHPVTSGFPTVDWFLSSDLMEPEDGAKHYVERMVRLPNLSICYAPLPSEGGRLSRTDLGLRADAVVYVCCQSLFKYLPADDGLFVAIAKRLPAAQFLFIGDPASPITGVFRRRLAGAFTAAGLDFDHHVAITKPVPPDLFPSLLKCGTIYLDSVGWSGGNTTLEAVACGLPPLTLPTDMMRGRHTAGILQRMGVTELIAESRDDYVEKAVALADPAARAAAKARVAETRGTLWNDMKPVKALEMWLDRAVGAATG